ncbi:multidrug effflux MFS transporter [Roseospirillum parvum]|uniref:Bcr/CflA family efflux transporter n=1 Tax=Roseospirillum parvum TaxID=83401 RepID=A0A1G7WJ31_9PROT|nr:multidrug effflux MFS transporter [Roseospirillum parvum]SDG71874.1 MFS transporter, DHA1 family, bicyclomycin/chloramphenicol resistance protein [Roseospirillum parvum]
MPHVPTPPDAAAIDPTPPAPTAPAPAAPSPGLGRSLLLILAAFTAAGPLSMQIFLPALPAIQSGFQVDPAASQLLISLAMAAFGVAQLAYGPLSDRFGRRPVLIFGLVLFLVGSAMCLLAPSLPLLVVGRIVQAAGSAAGMVLPRAIIRDLCDRAQAAHGIARLTTIMVIAPMLAPLAGAALSDLIHWRAIFLVITAFAGLTVWLALYRLTESNHQRSPLPGPMGMVDSYRGLLRQPLFVAYAGFAASTMGMFFVFMSAAPYLAIQVMGISATQYGLWFAAVSALYIVGNLSTSRIAHHIGLEGTLALGAAIALAGGLLLVVSCALAPWTPLTILGPALLMGLGNGIGLPQAQAGAVSVDPKRAGAASGLAGFTQMIAGAILAQTVGLLEDGTPWPMALLMLLTALSALLNAGLALRANKGASP